METGATYILTTGGQFNAAITSAQVAVYLTGAVSTQKRAVMHGLGDFMLSQVFKASTNNIDMKIAQNSGSARIATATMFLYKLQD